MQAKNNLIRALFLFFKPHIIYFQSVLAVYDAAGMAAGPESLIFRRKILIYINDI